MNNYNDNENNNEETVAQTGYVIAGGTELDQNALGWLIRSSFCRNMVPYDTFVEWARENDMERDEVPEMRKVSTAFAEAKTLITGEHEELPVMESLEGWDGRVSQELVITVLTKGSHYLVTLRRRGHRDGQKDVEDQNIMRLKSIVPEGFDANVWRNNYMESAWNDNVERLPIGSIDAIIDIRPYREDTEVDPILTNRIRQIVLNRLRIAAVSVDETKLSNTVYRAITGRMHGVRKDRKTDYLVPREGRNGETNGPLLAKYEAMVQFFADFNPTVHEWYTEVGTLSQPAVGTFFERVQWLDGDKERESASKAFTADLTVRHATYLDKVVRASEDFDTDNTDKAIARQAQLANEKRALEEFHGRLERDWGMTIEVPEIAHSQMRTRIVSRLNVVQGSSETVANQYRNLMRVRPRRGRLD